MREWPLSQARKRFGEVVRAAMAGEAQLLTRRGKGEVVVVAAEEYERLLRLAKASAPSFVELLLQMPQGGEEFERMPLPPRAVDLFDCESQRGS